MTRDFKPQTELPSRFELRHYVTAELYNLAEYAYSAPERLQWLLEYSGSTPEQLALRATAGAGWEIFTRDIPYPTTARDFATYFLDLEFATDWIAAICYENRLLGQGPQGLVTATLVQSYLSLFAEAEGRHDLAAQFQAVAIDELMFEAATAINHYALLVSEYRVKKDRE